MGTTPRGTEPSAWPQLDALVDRLLNARSRVAAAQAEEATILADAVEIMVEQAQRYRRDGRDRYANDLAQREVAAEIGAAMRVADRTVSARMSRAYTLTQRFAATLERWRHGDLDRAQVDVIVDAGATIDDGEARRRYEALVLVAAEQDGAARLRHTARSLAARLDPAGAGEALACAARARQVRVYDLGDGMARLLADLPAPLAYAVHDRLTRLAQADIDDGGELCALGDAPSDDDDASAGEYVPGTLRTEPAHPGDADGDSRTMDERRADILADLLLTTVPTGLGGTLDSLAGITAHVQIVIPALTLLGYDDGPALLARSGPIDPVIARRLAAQAPGWDRVLTDPTTGVPVSVDRYRPSAEQRRFLYARDEHCRFPQCRRPARQCDIDHTLDAALGGPTDAENLSAACPRHHTVKHHTRWRVRQRGGGALEWTSPTGRRYLDRPPSTVRFVPQPDHTPIPF